MDSGALPDVTRESLVIYVSIGVVIILAVATATEKGLGPISRWWFDFARRRREAAADARAADYDGLRTQQRHLQGQLNYVIAELQRMRGAEQERDQLAVEHVAWDREARRVLAAHGMTLPEPPPLWPARTANTPTQTDGTGEDPTDV